MKKHGFETMKKHWLAEALFLFGWVLLVSIGILVNLHYAGQIRARMTGANLNWLAAADLTANHQIQADDLIAPGTANLSTPLPSIDTLTGRYLRSPMKTGQSISPSDLLPLPAIPPMKDGSTILIYYLRPDESLLAQMLDPGRQAKVCAPQVADKNPKPVCLAASFEVLAVHQENGTNPKNWLLLRVPADIPADLSTYLASDHRYILVTTRSP